MKAYLSLIKHAINDMGYTVSVWDSEEWQVKRSTKYTDIKDAIESVDASELVFRDKEGNRTGWAYIVLFGNDPEETVSDYSISDDHKWIDNWFDRVVMA